MENVESNVERDTLKQMAREYLNTNRIITDDLGVVSQRDVQEWWNRRTDEDVRGFKTFYSIVRKEMKKQQRKLRKQQQAQFR